MQNPLSEVPLRDRELESLENQYHKALEISKDIDYHMKKVKSKDNFDKLLKQVSKRGKR